MSSIALSSSTSSHNTPNSSLITHFHSHHLFPLQHSLHPNILGAMASRDPDSDNQIIVRELEALSETMYQSHTRRTASLALPRTAVPPIFAGNDPSTNEKSSSAMDSKPRPRRMSLSPWRSRTKLDSEDSARRDGSIVAEGKSKWRDDDERTVTVTAGLEKKGIWNWKPIRALSHIGMQKISCLFSVEVVAIQGLPASMNGLRLSVCVRKKETKDGAVETLPSRVVRGGADFEEMLFVRCHVYYAPASGGAAMKFEPRPFLIYVTAYDAGELDFGRNTVDLSNLIRQSVERSFEGSRVRQWDTSYKLDGKAKGGELVVKLGFQIMEKDGGVGIYSQADGQSSKMEKNRMYSPSSFARKQSKSSFSVPSPRMTSRGEASTDGKKGAEPDIDDMDDLNLDEPAPAAAPLPKGDDVDFPEFDVVEKGVEIQEKNGEEKEEEERSEENSDKMEVVKEVVMQDRSHLLRLTELDSIAQQIKALESLMADEKEAKNDADDASPELDAEEDKVTREFLQMLEDAAEIDNQNPDDYDYDKMPPLKLENDESTADEAESEVYLPDLGKGLGCVVQTRNGGYLAAANPLDTVVSKKDTPKLAMQLSKPVVLQSSKTGFELFQKMAAVGVDELTSEIFSAMPIDELSGKTAEQIAFEGIASAIIHGRSKERASSSAARTVAAVKTIGKAMSAARKERISTGIWNVAEEPVTVDDILAFSMQKIESMSIDALRIQGDIVDEEAPFDVSPLDAKTVVGNKAYDHILASAIPVEDWIKVTTSNTDDDNVRSETITVAVIVQLRDPLRQYEAVGGPMIALIQATSEKFSGDGERVYKVGSLQVGGVKSRASSGSKNAWSSERQRLTALQWLVAYGLGKPGKKPSRPAATAAGPSILWSISARVMADMWLKQIRNPDVKFNK
ncbi:protein PLASTID MOVEMENT IMPAIRED 1 [Andrographis paniculata]|uniref:protein PLASTID MOVEMENT IMPAIRED 1 n=1 Tax=Andrographis paniculata TaxID=175694 RepID=UPI0021E91676|nr:protein PLASTID MOVEMENT IMPAIRED 1 [Andrographis paniculata]